LLKNTEEVHQKHFKVFLLCDDIHFFLFSLYYTLLRYIIVLKKL